MATLSRVHVVPPEAELPHVPDGEPVVRTLAEAPGVLRVLRRERGGPGEAVLHPGDHVLDEGAVLTAEDSGTPDSPTVVRAEAGARLLGGRRLTGWKPVSDPAVLARLPEAARGHVLEADLSAAGISDFGTQRARGFGRPSEPAALELFVDGAPMHPARWPNEGWLSIADVPEGAAKEQFCYEGDRPKGWKTLDGIWVHGYWTWNWAESMERAAEFDLDARRITTAPPHGVYGYKQGGRFYFFNVLEELDAPGEYFADRDRGTVYFYPPAPLESAEVLASALEEPMLTVDGASHVRVQGLAFACTRYHGIVVRGGEDVAIEACSLTSIGCAGIVVDGGTRHAVRHCALTDMGEGGISLQGGERETLTPGGHVAEDNRVSGFSRVRRTYTPALHVSGAGNRLAHNLVEDSPHMAIGLGGNDHVVEFNEVRRVCLETDDAGAFYMGRDWTARGNVIRYNVFHHLGSGDVQAVYLDDFASGTTVLGNVCHGAFRGVLLGGGRDNRIERNVFLNCKHAIHIDQRGIGWAKYYIGGSTTTLYDLMERYNAAEPPFSERYPELKTLTDDEPGKAKGNAVTGNVVQRCEHFLHLCDGLTPDTPYLTIRDNRVEADAAVPGLERFGLEAGAGAAAEALPLEKVGPRDD